MQWLDPDHLPHVTSNVERFLLNPRGDADGMILVNGLEVHFPPHLSASVCAAIQPGHTVRVYGVRPRSTTMISAVAIETEDGQRILDNGPGQPKDKKARNPQSPKHRAMEAEGLVRRALHGPKGEVRGVLLDDGTIVRVDPHGVDAIAGWLSEGQRLAVSGDGLVTELGTIIEARSVGPSKDTLRQIKPKKSKKPKKDKPHHHSEHVHGVNAT
jgi:hypothetical protein